MKQILIFVDWFEPGYKAGGPIQSCKNFAMVMKDEFIIRIITGDRDTGDTMPYKNVAVNDWNDYEKNVKVYYASPGQISFKTLDSLITDVAPDFIYVNSMYSFRCAILPMLWVRKRKFTIPLILSPRGMLHKGGMQFKAFKKKLFIRALNLSQIPRHIIFHATDDQEQLDVLHYFPKAKRVFLAENFPTTHEVAWQMVEKESGSIRLIYLSRVVAKKNILYLLKLFLENKLTFQVSLDIAGEVEDQDYWGECMSVIEQLPENVRVNYIGPIPNHEIFSRYKYYHVFVLPTLGENFGHAIYEALLCGKPAVLSDQTPWKGLSEKKVGYDIPLDQPFSFIKAFQHFADMNQEEYDLWSKSAQQLILKNRNIKAVKERYLQIFN